jgi:AraC-like DNA-binding protein
VSMRVVQTMIDSVVETGVSRACLLSGAKLEPAFVRDLDARVPRSKLFELCGLALELTGDPAFGLHSIERLATDALNPIGALVVHSATLQDALRSVQEFRCLLGDEASFRVYEDAGKTIVQSDSLRDQPLHVRRFMAEIGLAGLFRTIQRFRAQARIDYVAFEYSAPDYQNEYARVFAGQARFDQSFTGLCFSSQLMKAAAPHPDPELHQALRVIATRRVAQLTDRSSCSARIHQFLVWQPPPRDMSMQTAARTLGMSVRSLRRHLTAEGKTYAGLVNEALASIAKSCLRDEQRTILETGHELGFADNTGFHRAFKRWTGLTPTQYRKQQATDSSSDAGEIQAHSRAGRTASE